MKHLLPALAAFSLLFLAGCINAPTSSCPPADSNCIYSQAVLQQDPYLCYNLPESQREACFKSATNPLEKNKLQNRQQITPLEKPQQGQQQTQPSSPAPENKTGLELALTQCESSQDADNCFFSLAKSNSAVKICESVKSKQARNTCISNVALSTKKPAECSLLATDEEKTLCLAYSSG